MVVYVFNLPYQGDTSLNKRILFTFLFLIIFLPAICGRADTHVVLNSTNESNNISIALETEERLLCNWTTPSNNLKLFVANSTYKSSGDMLLYSVTTSETIHHSVFSNEKSNSLNRPLTAPEHTYYTYSGRIIPGLGNYPQRISRCDRN